MTSESPRAWARRAAPFASVVLLAAAARLALLPGMAVLQPDGCTYLWTAEDLARGALGGALAAHKPPLYPALIALAHLAGAPLEAAGYGVSIALGALAAAPLLAAFRRASGSLAVGLAGAALYALQPESVRAGADVMSEATFSFFVAGALAAGLRALDEGSPLLAAAAGALSGLAYLARPEGLAVALGLGLILCLGIVLAGARRHARALAGLAIGLALTAAPYAAYISHADGRLELSRKHAVAALLGLDGRAAAAAARPAEGEEGLRALVPGATLGGRPDPRATAGERALALARSTGRALRLLADALHPLLAALALLGLAAAGRRPGARGVLTVIAAFAGLAALLDWQAGYLHRRHLATAAALATLFAGAGAVAVARRLPWRAGRLALGAAIAAILLAKALAPQFAHRAGFREAGAWLREHGGEGALAVGLFGTEIAYYGGARELPMPPGPASRVIEFARARGARFIAISIRSRTGEPDPRIEAALEAEGLSPAYRKDEVADGRHYRRLIYALR